jgi:hypothetical protein
VAVLHLVCAEEMDTQEQEGKEEEEEKEEEKNREAGWREDEVVQTL